MRIQLVAVELVVVCVGRTKMRTRRRRRCGLVGRRWVRRAPGEVRSRSRILDTMRCRDGYRYPSFGFFWFGFLVCLLDFFFFWLEKIRKLGA